MAKYVFALILFFVATFAGAQISITQPQTKYNKSAWLSVGTSTLVPAVCWLGHNGIPLLCVGGTTRFVHALVKRFTVTKPNTKYGGYKVTRAKIVGIGIASIGGLADGMVEGYEFDGRTSFERKWGKNPRGYWGSESWRSVYRHGDPANGFISPVHKVVGAFDFYHHADDLRKAGYLGGGVVIGIGGSKSNTVWWHYVVDFGASFVCSSITKAAGYYWIRN